MVVETLFALLNLRVFDISAILTSFSAVAIDIGLVVHVVLGTVDLRIVDTDFDCDLGINSCFNEQEGFDLGFSAAVLTLSLDVS